MSQMKMTIKAYSISWIARHRVHRTADSFSASDADAAMFFSLAGHGCHNESHARALKIENLDLHGLVGSC